MIPTRLVGPTIWLRETWNGFLLRERLQFSGYSVHAEDMQINELPPLTEAQAAKLKAYFEEQGLRVVEQDGTWLIGREEWYGEPRAKTAERTAEPTDAEDAARYRWMRQHAKVVHRGMGFQLWHLELPDIPVHMDDEHEPEDFDLAVDLTRGAKKLPL